MMETTVVSWGVHIQCNTVQIIEEIAIFRVAMHLALCGRGVTLEARIQVIWTEANNLQTGGRVQVYNSDSGLQFWLRRS